MASNGLIDQGYSTATDQVFRGQWNFDGLGRPVGPSDVDGAGVEGIESPVDSLVLVDPRGTRLSDEGHPAFPKPERPKRHRGRWILIGALVLGLSGAGIYFGAPLVRESLETVSTDDAFVTAHVSNISPRLEDVVTEVLVDQNDHVEAGTLLVRLDRQPFEIALGQAEAALEESRSQLSLAHAQVNSQLAQARGSFFRRKNEQEQLRRTATTLKAQVATLHAKESSLRLAEVDHRRIDNLVKRGSATQAELDTRNNTLDVASEEVKEAWAAIQETRASLGLSPDSQDPLKLPKDLEEQQSRIQSAVSDISSALAQIGIPFDAHAIKDGDAFEQLLRLDSSEGLSQAFDNAVERAPAVQVARASVVKAERDVDDAKRKLGYTEIRSEIAGYVQDRSVHPGNRVSPGQTLITIRPSYVWVTANYKETQLQHLRIGLPVDLYVDAYPKKVFRGRVAGFSPGTGLSESLLPPENATGNYVKVTQRLPVRIELAGPNPDDAPLFVGLSVVPYVRIKETPTGPGAGARLHSTGRTARRDVGQGPTGVLPGNADASRGPSK
ncbi:HlyD family secretion protein [Singulisphaera rosea]